MSDTNSDDGDIRKTMDSYENEIELIDLLRIIWRRKYLIILGTLSLALVTGIVCIFYPKIFRVEMILEPGRYSRDGISKSYLDSANKIQFQIESGAYDNFVLDILKKDNESNIPTTLNFKVFYSRPAEALTVAYETPDKKHGLKILNLLISAIQKQYDPMVNAIKDKYDAQITQKQSKILNLRKSNQLSNAIIRSIEGRIQELKLDIEKLDFELENIKIGQQKIASQKKDDNVTIDDQLSRKFNLLKLGSTLTDFKNDLSDYKIQTENERLLTLEREMEIEELLSDVSLLEISRRMVENVNALKPPTIHPEPVRPQPILYIAIALSLGLFTTLFLTFLLEYIKKFNQVKANS